MEIAVDSYLHKKFKKQLSIEPRPQHNDKENNNRRLEAGEEKTDDIGKQGECSKVADTHSDNKNSVPNQSTNPNTQSIVSNLSKSSISVGNCLANQQSTNHCISYIEAHNPNEEQASFDTSFNEPTNSSISTSSILNSIYYKHSYAPGKEDSVIYEQTDDPSDLKSEEIQPPPDRNASGKYVCTYCSLVCSKPSVLQKHIRAHTNERPYPCISCGFSFKTRSNLYKHCRSRTHANRVMGNKPQEPCRETDNQIQRPPPHSPQNYIETKEDQPPAVDIKLKPYKPRFHTNKQFFETVAKENIEEERQNSKNPTSDLISHHINEIINKNNSIVNSNESTFIKKCYNELVVDTARANNNDYNIQKSGRSESYSTEEPLNLSSKNRKRCMSEIAEPVVQKSLIKELLLKNLYSNDMQCPYCKMIFQTVTELDVHKYRNCKGKPSGIKYTRSSSVNVASILTHNKNAFDNIPQFQNTVFPLNSPGPFLGKTRLVETDKTKSFSFDSGNMPLMSPNETSPNYLLSPLPFDREKKLPVKLFGGEVKIHSSGETKSFKIDNKDDKYDHESGYGDFGGKLSENRVIKSSLQSGGTVLTNKTSYNKQDIRAPQDVIRVYENTSVSPSIDITSLNKPQFNFDNHIDSVPEEAQRTGFSVSNEGPKTTNHMYRYTNIMDFSQNAVKMLTPNIKQPSISVPGLSVPKKLSFNHLPVVKNKPDVNPDNRKPTPDEIDVSKPHNYTPTPDVDTNLRNNALKNQILQRKAFYEPQPAVPATTMCNPLNLLVNGKVIRYVPGMPGPVAAEGPVDMAYGGIVPVGRATPKETTPALDKPEPIPDSPKPVRTNHFLVPEKIERLNRSPSKMDALEVKTDFPTRVSEVRSPVKNESKSPVKSLEMRSADSLSFSETKKFARPNSLALKPTTASLKQHHGLTPTMFNQILISPDTPRVAKKYAEHFLHGNYFSYLGLKSSTKPVYCTLNKTQPFYVPHFKKLSMYSEWRQQDTKTDKLYVGNYDSGQKSQRYTVAGHTSADLIVHSSYKFVVSEVTSSKSEKGDEQKSNTIPGGYECNDDYTYIRGRGRGRYVCDQCGIRCKKPSMLKKHIRTHSNERPYTCSHCNFSFKTKGNLTKHMKSKAHTKNYTASGGSGSSTQQSATQSSESDTEDSGMDSSDESTRQQEHEAAYGLLSLSQKPTQTSSPPCQSDLGLLRSSSPVSNNELFMSTEEIAYVSKTNYAKNKILDERNSLSFTTTRRMDLAVVTTIEESTEMQNVTNYLGKSNITRPLTYPYTSMISNEDDIAVNTLEVSTKISKNNDFVLNHMEPSSEPKSIKQFHVIQKYAPPSAQQIVSPKVLGSPSKMSPPPKKIENMYNSPERALTNNVKNLTLNPSRVLPTLKVNDIVIHENLNDLRKRKIPVIQNLYKSKIQRNDEVMDLSMPTSVENQEKPPRLNGSTDEHHFNNTRPVEHGNNVASEVYTPRSPQGFDVNVNEDEDLPYSKGDITYKNPEATIANNLVGSMPNENPVNINFEHPANVEDHLQYVQDYDNSAMETLADIATQREKLDKNTLAKNVASEFLKLATKNEEGCRDMVQGYGPINKDVNDIIVKSEGSKSCSICSKSFNKPSQLRLHMNIHYLERPFRCDSCSVSFRTKGHLQKHERSASHHNKLSSSPTLSSLEPRPFKCSDCNIAFRIHGHLAKHLRSKMHIMKLECLAKIPFGLYAELERSNSLLTEINTCDGDQCLESLKTLAMKVFINDPNKLDQLELRENVNATS